jgi:hypothetical protein
MSNHMNTIFELCIDSWRTVQLTEAKAMPSYVNSKSTIIFYKPVLLVSTPFMPELEGTVAVTLYSLETGTCTWLRLDKPNQVIGFRACNEHSEAWLREQLAKAAGMKFRHHGMVDPSKIIYTKEA